MSSLVKNLVKENCHFELSFPDGPFELTPSNKWDQLLFSFVNYHKNIHHALKKENTPQINKKSTLLV